MQHQETELLLGSKRKQAIKKINTHTKKPTKTLLRRSRCLVKKNQKQKKPTTITIYHSCYWNNLKAAGGVVQTLFIIFEVLSLAVAVSYILFLRSNLNECSLQILQCISKMSHLWEVNQYSTSYKPTGDRL